MKRTHYKKPRHHIEEYDRDREYASNMNEREAGPYQKNWYEDSDERAEPHHSHGRFGDHYGGDFEGYQKYHGMSRNSRSPIKAKKGYHGRVGLGHMEDFDVSQYFSGEFHI